VTSHDYGPAYTGSASSPQAGDILYPMRVSLFIALLLMGYVTREWESLPPWQRKASDRAIERYTRSQEKKWRRWNEAMFERSG